MAESCRDSKFDWHPTQWRCYVDDFTVTTRRRWWCQKWTTSYHKHRYITTNPDRRSHPAWAEKVLWWLIGSEPNLCGNTPGWMFWSAGGQWSWQNHHFQDDDWRLAIIIRRCFHRQLQCQEGYQTGMGNIRLLEGLQLVLPFLKIYFFSLKNRYESRHCKW